MDNLGLVWPSVELKAAISMSAILLRDTMEWAGNKNMKFKSALVYEGGPHRRIIGRI